MPANRPVVPGPASASARMKLQTSTPQTKSCSWPLHPIRALQMILQNATTQTYTPMAPSLRYVENRFAGSYSERYLPWQALSRSGDLDSLPGASGPDGPRQINLLIRSHTQARSPKQNVTWPPLFPCIQDLAKGSNLDECGGQPDEPSLGAVPFGDAFPNGEISPPTLAAI